MQVIVVVQDPDGTERPPTQEELQWIAERYVCALLERSLPGSQVRIRRAAGASAPVAFADGVGLGSGATVSAGSRPPRRLHSRLL